MNKKRNFSKKALRDFKLIDLAIKSNDQNAFKKLMNNYKSLIYFTILKRTPSQPNILFIFVYSLEH